MNGELFVFLCGIAAVIVMALVLLCASAVPAAPAATGPQCPNSAPPPEWPETKRGAHDR